MENERDHRVRSELCAHCPTDSLPFCAPRGTDNKCVLWIFYKGTAAATRLIVFFLEALQVRIKATMARKRLRQVKANLTVLSIQPGGEFRDQTVIPSPGLVTMPSRLPFLEEFQRSVCWDNSHHHTSLCREQLLQESMVVNGT